MLRVEAFQFDAGVAGCEALIGDDMAGASLLDPACDLIGKGRHLSGLLARRFVSSGPDEVRPPRPLIIAASFALMTIRGVSLGSYGGPCRSSRLVALAKLLGRRVFPDDRAQALAKISRRKTSPVVMTARRRGPSGEARLRRSPLSPTKTRPRTPGASDFSHSLPP